MPVCGQTVTCNHKSRLKMPVTETVIVLSISEGVWLSQFMVKLSSWCLTIYQYAALVQKSGCGVGPSTWWCRHWYGALRLDLYRLQVQCLVLFRGTTSVSCYSVRGYRRSGFNCEYLLIANCEYFLCSQLIDSQTLMCAYTIIWYGVDHRIYWIHSLAWLA